MKKEILFIATLLLICGALSGQHLIRVNNNPGADADYTTLQAANDAASNGDTIYIEGSPTEYDGADISKKLVIIGPGYFLTDNDSTQAFGHEAKFPIIRFIAGSGGSIIAGCHCGSVTISTNNISIIRCYTSNIEQGADADNLHIQQNYISTLINLSHKTTNSIISNNIVGGWIQSTASSGPLQVTNNILTNYGCYLNVWNASIANNIIADGFGKININTGNTIVNNILASAGTNADGNQYNVAMANVFVSSGSQDARYKLKTGSPAIGAGVSGVDCGIFGGPNPYVLSGIPNLPHIYDAYIPGTAYSDKGLACTIKVKSGK